MPAVVGIYEGEQTTETTSITSDSFTPTDGNKLVIFVSFRRGLDAADPSLSGGSLTYTEIDRSASLQGNVIAFEADVSGTPGSMTITATYTGGTVACRSAMFIVEVSDHNGIGASGNADDHSVTSITTNLTTTIANSMIISSVADRGGSNNGFVSSEAPSGYGDYNLLNVSSADITLAIAIDTDVGGIGAKDPVWGGQSITHNRIGAIAIEVLAAVSAQEMEILII